MNSVLIHIYNFMIKFHTIDNSQRKNSPTHLFTLDSNTFGANTLRSSRSLNLVYESYIILIDGLLIWRHFGLSKFMTDHAYSLVWGLHYQYWEIAESARVLKLFDWDIKLFEVLTKRRMHRNVLRHKVVILTINTQSLFLNHSCYWFKLHCGTYILSLLFHGGHCWVVHDANADQKSYCSYCVSSSHLGCHFNCCRITEGSFYDSRWH